MVIPEVTATAASASSSAASSSPRSRYGLGASLGSLSPAAETASYLGHCPPLTILTVEPSRAISASSRWQLFRQSRS